ncbi:MAG: hypothetical protein ACJ72S_12670 [Nitrososphaeraceae archaeon]
MRHAGSRAFSFLVLIVAFSLIYAGILNTAVSSIGNAFAKKGSKKSSSSGGDSNDENTRVSDRDKGSSNTDTDNNNLPEVEPQTTTRGEGAGAGAGEEQGSESTVLPPPLPPAAVLDAKNNNIPIPGAVDPAICTPDLKRFVVHLFNETLNGKPILKILNPCVTVTGTVIGNGESRIPHIREEEDSDLIINLLPDPEFKSLASPPNTRFTGAIHLEAICQGNNFDTATGLVSAPRLHIGDCKGFNGPHFAIPSVGDRLKVTGVYVQDIGEGGHTELHPVYKIETIGNGSPNTSLSSLKEHE